MHIGVLFFACLFGVCVCVHETKAVQVQANGLLQQKRWEEVAAVIDLYAGPNSGDAHDGGRSSTQGGDADGADSADSAALRAACNEEVGCTQNAGADDETKEEDDCSGSGDGVDADAAKAAAFDAASASVDNVEVPELVQELLVTILRNLIRDHRLTAENSLLTDRTFLVKALRVIKAHAFLHGRTTVAAPEDLSALRFMTTFRLPSKVHALVPKAVASAVTEALGAPAHASPAPTLPPTPTPLSQTAATAEAEARQRGSLVGSGLRGSKRGRQNAAAAGIRLPPSNVVPAGKGGPTPSSAASTRADGNNGNATSSSSSNGESVRTGGDGSGGGGGRGGGTSPTTNAAVPTGTDTDESRDRMAMMSLEAVKHKPWRQELQIPFQFPGDKRNNRDSRGKVRK